jgi:acyl-CoA dehydrogenase
MLTVDDFAYDAFANDKSTLIDHNATSAKASPSAETSVK